MNSIEHYREAFNTFMESRIQERDPAQLYRPMTYILQLGGKRLRPVLTLMTTDAMGGDFREALPAALALEMFHNFSLVHDDIMDAAPLRRGKPTVHIKWDVNTGILSGDAMLIQSYQLFEAYEPALFKALTGLFTRTALEVCEGQQYDVDFETTEDVGIGQYLQMIRCKTAVLLGACMKMGASIGGASEAEQQAAYNFGLDLGIAFQLQDDYLDAFGDPETFGKQVGGDIMENKKTYLYLKAIEMADASEIRELQQLFSIKPHDREAKVKRVCAIYEDSGASSQTRKEIQRYTMQAFEYLDELKLPDAAAAGFRDFGETLMERIS